MFKRIKGYSNYAVSPNSTVYKADIMFKGSTPTNSEGKVQIISPYYSDRDNCLYVNLFKGKKRTIRAVHNLVGDAFIERTEGKVLICKNGDYRNCQLDNLLEVSRSDAHKFKRGMFSPTRLQDFYNIFLDDPRPDTFYQLPIDVQYYVKERGVVEWQPKMLEYPNHYTSN